MYSINFKDVGIDSLSPQELASSLEKLEKSTPLTTVLNFLSDKLGFNHAIDKLYQMGLERLVAWSLISADHDNITGYECQSTRAKDSSNLKKCIKSF
jgi:hypothetical protein